VAHCLAEVIWRHGDDRAAEFLSDVLQDTVVIMGLEQFPMSGGHPQTDGLVERLNKTLKAMLSRCERVDPERCTYAIVCEICTMITD